MLTGTLRIEDSKLDPIAEKVLAGERLSFDEGVALYESGDLLALGYLANHVRERAAREAHLFQCQPAHQSDQRVRGQLQALRLWPQARCARRLHHGAG